MTRRLADAVILSFAVATGYDVLVSVCRYLSARRNTGPVSRTMIERLILEIAREPMRFG